MHQIVEARVVYVLSCLCQILRPHLLSHDLHLENKAYKRKRFIANAFLGLTLLIEVRLG